MNETGRIKVELEKAKVKHPFFAHVPVQDFHNQFETAAQLTNARVVLKEEMKRGHVQGLTVLVCEMLEAVDAYAQGNKPNCIIELAQVATVAIRMMEGVEVEIEREGGLK